MYAVIIGLRGKATTMLVRTTRVSVVASASVATVNGSWIVRGYNDVSHLAGLEDEVDLDPEPDPIHG